MSDVHGAAPAAGSDRDQVADAGPDDGLTPEERIQFSDMQRETSAPASSEPSPEPAPTGADDSADDAAEAAADAAEAAAAANGKTPPKASPEEDGLHAWEMDEDAQPRRVSKSKIVRAIKDAKALQKELQTTKATLAEKDAMQARLDERLRIINEALTTPAPAAADNPAKKVPPLPKAEDDPEPDMEADIFAWAQWSKRDNARLRQDFTQGQQVQQQEKQAENANRQMENDYWQDHLAFKASEPNFMPAYEFLMASRVAELAVHYYGKDLSVDGQKLTQQEYNQISQTIVGEERKIVGGAIKAGRSPAAQLFAIAKSRGFRPPAAAAAPAGEAGKPNGAAAANGAAKPANGAAAVPGALGTEKPASVVDEIARVRNGQDAALSLSGGGGAPPATIDAAKLANMSQDEFEEMVETMSPAALKKMMGG